MRSRIALSRRNVLKVAGAALLPIAGRQGTARLQRAGAGNLQDPGMAGRPRERITDFENDPFIIEIESQLSCTCPCTLDVYTCRTTDFTCTTSPAMHREVVRLVQQGNSAQGILDSFVAEYGETVLMAPPRGGFNLVGYVLPGLGILGVGAAMLWMLMGRSRPQGEAVAMSTGPGRADPGISAEDVARLEKELGELDL